MQKETSIVSNEEAKYQVKGTPVAEDTPKVEEEIPKNENQSNRKVKGKGKDSKKKDSNPEDGPENAGEKKKFMKDIELGEYMTHAEAAKAISRCLQGYKDTTPSAINPTIIHWMQK